MVTRSAVGLALLTLTAANCSPEFEGPPSLVTRPRVLAVRSQPAEAAPGRAVVYDGLFVGPDGPLDASDLTWALCEQRAAPSERGSIADACLLRESPVLAPLGAGASALAVLPEGACQLFGPAPNSGAPSARPVDPDPSGGYYQPVRVLSGVKPGDLAVGETRLACGLGGATEEQARSFAEAYRANENPALDALTLRHADGSEQPLGGDPVRVSPGERVQLRASWTACPSDPVCGDGICSPGEDASPDSCPDDCAHPRGCTGAEPYAYFDPVQGTLRDRHEALRLSWFASDGRFEHDRTGRAESGFDQTDSENLWDAPQDERDIWLWVVIRDDRGGVGFGSYQLQSR